MTSQEIKDFVRLNEQFRFIADTIILELGKKFNDDDIIGAIGVVDEMELKTDLRVLSGREDQRFVWFQEANGGDEGLSVKIPLEAFTATSTGLKKIVQQAVDEAVAEINSGTEYLKKQEEARERETYERLKKKFEENQ